MLSSDVNGCGRGGMHSSFIPSQLAQRLHDAIVPQCVWCVGLRKSCSAASQSKMNFLPLCHRPDSHHLTSSFFHESGIGVVFFICVLIGFDIISLSEGESPTQELANSFGVNLSPCHGGWMGCMLVYDLTRRSTSLAPSAAYCLARVV